MKRIRPWISAILGCICLIPATRALGQVSPLTWSSFVIAAGPLGPYDSSQPATSNVVSRFTPARAIKVTRIEIQAAQGTERFIFSPSFAVVACTKPIAFKITDGSKSFALPLPSAGTLIAGAFNPSSADSDKLSLEFPADAKIEMTVVLGDLPAPDGSVGGCVAGNINITVQYAIDD
jgi:hypothetical protein